MKRAIIVGSKGQDGRILTEMLARGGYEILPISREAGSIDISDRRAVTTAVEQFSPDEIYYLAAFHHSAEDKAVIDEAELFQRSHDVHVAGLLNFLEAARLKRPNARFFYAASSHLFGDCPDPIQTERTPFLPRNAYGITKLLGVDCCRFYRRAHALHVSVGILYNHESPYRRADFLSQKIVRAVVAIARGRQQKLVLGNLNAVVDWSYAPDVVAAMTRILVLPTPDDFIIASGQPHTVEDFCAAAFSTVGLDWRSHVEQDATLLTKPAGRLIGDSTKLRDATGWKPTVSFEEMVKFLVAAEEQRSPG